MRGRAQTIRQSFREHRTITIGRQVDTPQAQAHDRTGTQTFLDALGVRKIGPRSSPFDPGYDPQTLKCHLEQSAHLMDVLKISMGCWLIAHEDATRAKIAAANAHGVATTTGGGPFEIAVAQNRLAEYLELCVALGFTRIECGEGFTELSLGAQKVVDAAREVGLEVQFELGKKHDGAFHDSMVDELIAQGQAWLEAGACCLVVEARESAVGVGLFAEDGTLDEVFADRFAEMFGLEIVTFEAPNKSSQFALLDHFGPQVKLGNVRLEELLRVETYRRGLHSDSFGRENLRPKIVTSS
jgi:phosphosulfolactate synthase